MESEVDDATDDATAVGVKVQKDNDCNNDGALEIYREKGRARRERGDGLTRLGERETVALFFHPFDDE